MKVVAIGKRCVAGLQQRTSLGDHQQGVGVTGLGGRCFQAGGDGQHLLHRGGDSRLTNLIQRIAHHLTRVGRWVIDQSILGRVQHDQQLGLHVGGHVRSIHGGDHAGQSENGLRRGGLLQCFARESHGVLEVVAGGHFTGFERDLQGFQRGDRFDAGVGGVAREQRECLGDRAEHALTLHLVGYFAGSGSLIVVGSVTDALVHQLCDGTEHGAGLVERNRLAGLDARLQRGQRREHRVPSFALRKRLEGRDRLGDVGRQITANLIAITAHFVDVEARTTTGVVAERRTGNGHHRVVRIITGVVVARFVIRIVFDGGRGRRRSGRGGTTGADRVLDRLGDGFQIARLDALPRGKLREKSIHSSAKILLHGIRNRCLSDSREKSVQFGAQFGES